MLDFLFVRVSPPFYYMPPKHRPCLPLTYVPWRHSTWSARGNFFRSNGTSLFGTTRSPQSNLPSISSTISRHCNAVFGHTARLDEEVPAHKALWHYIDLTLGRLPSREWKRPPSRPRCRWIDHIHRDNDKTPPADLWRIAVQRGHRGATLRPSLASRWWRRFSIGYEILAVQHIFSYFFTTHVQKWPNFIPPVYNL